MVGHPCRFIETWPSVKTWGTPDRIVQLHVHPPSCADILLLGSCIPLQFLLGIFLDMCRYAYCFMKFHDANRRSIYRSILSTHFSKNSGTHRIGTLAAFHAVSHSSAASAASAATPRRQCHSRGAAHPEPLAQHRQRRDASGDSFGDEVRA